MTFVIKTKVREQVAKGPLPCLITHETSVKVPLEDMHTRLSRPNGAPEDLYPEAGTEQNLDDSYQR